MRILGIETSCDETAAAVVEMKRGKPRLLSNVVFSQMDLHKEFGGVVPEVAARSHLEIILPIVEKAIKRAKLGWEGIDGIAVTYGPGLPGAVLVGTTTAKTLALVKNKPLYAVNHVEGHVYANWLLPDAPKFPLLALIVSGLHSQLVLFKDHFDYKLLGQTQDDAVGEAFDKVARMLGLGYPGGPAIATIAKLGDADKYPFPKAKMQGKYDFSYSGLKTAVLRHLQKLVGKDYTFPSFEIAPLLQPQQIADTAASFQKAAVSVLVEATTLAYSEYKPRGVVIGGGAASNQELRKQLKRVLPPPAGGPIAYAPGHLCTDNAAMIATLGCFVANSPAGEKRPANPLTLETNPSLSM